jgi:hypothetical protein
MSSDTVCQAKFLYENMEGVESEHFLSIFRCPLNYSPRKSNRNPPALTVFRGSLGLEIPFHSSQLLVYSHDHGQVVIIPSVIMSLEKKLLIEGQHG